MLTYVVYSHTEYLPILTIETDYLQKAGLRAVLLINKPEPEIQTKFDPIFANYDHVYFYDDNQSYASKLLQCFANLKSKYILFFHDNDIILNVETTMIDKLVSVAEEHQLDRVELKHVPINGGHQIRVNDQILLSRNTDVKNYIYNVNPSIWKLDSFRDLMSHFPERTYRDIEYQDVQEYCLKYQVYTMNSTVFLECGYFRCAGFFKFLHITHKRKILPLNKEHKTVYGQSYSDASREFREIVDRYSLKDTHLWRKSPK